MTRPRFFLLAALIGWFAHDGKSQTIRMTASSAPFVDSSGQWIGNICKGWTAYPNPSLQVPPFNSTARTASTGIPITCTFVVTPGLYRVVVRVLEPVQTYNSVGARVFGVFANGQALAMIDPYALAGATNTPASVEAVVSVPANSLTLSFTQIKSAALFCGIELHTIREVYGETPQGAINGTNAAFTLSRAPVAGTLRIRVNGLQQDAGAYLLTGTALTLPAPPQPGDTLSADYRY